jgi:hypothetical protein
MSMGQFQTWLSGIDALNADFMNQGNSGDGGGTYWQLD